MSPTYEAGFDPEREQLIALARGADDLTLYARVEVQRVPNAVVVTFEPEWVFVGLKQLVIDRLVVTLSESADPDTGAPRRKLAHRATEVSQGRAIDKAELGQEQELLKDSLARRTALDVVELALKKYGNLGSHGDLTAGLVPLCAKNKVVIYEEGEVYAVTINPRGPRGGEPRYEFRVKKRDGVIDEVVVAIVPAIGEVPVPPTQPEFKRALGESLEHKTDLIARPLGEPSTGESQGSLFPVPDHLSPGDTDELMPKVQRPDETQDE